MNSVCQVLDRLFFGTIATEAAQIFIATKTLTNAQIKSLPGTPVQIVAAPASGYRIKLIGATLRLRNNSGAYTGVSAIYAGLQFQAPAVAWQSFSLQNDNSLATPLTKLTDFLAVTHNPATTGAGGVVDFAAPYVAPISGGAAGNEGYPTTVMSNAEVDLDGTALEIGLYNNGSATDLGGGNAANTLKVTVYYVIEAL
jgi:hypothetical protein